MDAISRLLKPRSVAIIGASADATKTSGRPIAYLQKHGFKGDIYPVNPRVDSIAGLNAAGIEKQGETRRKASVAVYPE